MKVNREEILRTLSSVSAGTATREVIEQSSCFCFRNGTVFTFDGEIAITAKCNLDFEAAVPAKPLADLLAKLAEPEIDIRVKDGELLVQGKGRKSGIRCEETVVLPVDSVAAPAIDDPVWSPLDGAFCEAVDLVTTCIADENDVFSRKCMHIHPDYLEGCDNYQCSRYPVSTPIGAECMIRGKVAKNIVGLGMSHITETEAWLHFCNPNGLILSCRRWVDKYPSLDPMLTFQGTKATLPGGLATAVANAEIFSAENAQGNYVRVDLVTNQLRLRGQGSLGWYEERPPIVYSGPPLSFMMAPKLLASLGAKGTQECEVAEGRMRLNLGKATYVACLLAAGV